MKKSEMPEVGWVAESEIQRKIRNSIQKSEIHDFHPKKELAGARGRATRGDDAESELRTAVLASARETLRDLTKVTSASTSPVEADGAAAAARYKGAYRTALVCTAENVEALLEQIAGIESGR